MAKNARAVVPAKPQQVGFAVANDFDESLEDEARRLRGAGTSQAADDNLVPFIYVLQSNSPQLKPKNPKYIEGAKDGMLLRTDTKELFEKIIFVPCAFVKKVNEWIPRDDGGGFVRSHDKMPADAIKHPEKERWMQTPDGEHDLIDTRYHYGFLCYEDGRASPACITMKGTQHGVSRAWMVQQNNRLTPGGVIAPAWWTAYELSTVARTNAQGDWNVIDTRPLGWVGKELREKGQALYQSVMAGEKKVDHAAEEDDDVGSKDPI